MISPPAQSPLDPALAENIRELAELAREIGADAVTILRQPNLCRLPLGVDNGHGPAGPLGDLKSPITLIIQFPATDGGTQRVELL